jgi:hypothetical protein
MTQGRDETAGGRLTPGSWFFLGGGVAILCMGIAIFVWARPSPHGYIEIFLAVPTMSVGGAIAALALLMSSRRLSRPARIFAWLLLIGSLAPLASIAHLMARTRP